MKLSKGKTPASMKPREGAIATGRFAVVFADLNGDGSNEVIGRYQCSAGNVTWPEWLLIVAPGGRTLGSVRLEGNRTKSYVNGFTVTGRTLAVDWTAFDGAGFHYRYLRSSLSLDSSGAHLTDTAPSPTPTTQVDEASFASPSGHLTCKLTASRAKCDVVGQSFASPAKPASCDLNWGQTLSVSVGQAANFACVGDPSYVGEDEVTTTWFSPQTDVKTTVFGGVPAYGLGYGHTLTSEGLTCVINKSSGVTCQTLDGAHGFTLATQAYRLW